MDVSLRSCLEADTGQRTSRPRGAVRKDRSAHDASSRALRIRLRDALFERMSGEKIASLLAADPERARREVRAVLEQLVQSVTLTSGSTSSDAEMVREVAHMVLGLGPLEELLEAPEVTEIMVNGPDAVFYEREGKIHPCAITFFDERQLRMVIDRIIGPLGRRVDEQSPLVSARLPQGHRVNVIIPPLALNGPILTIRKFPDRAFTLDELISFNSLDTAIAQLLRWAVVCRRTIAVSGGTGSGKTTLLNALSIEIPHNERIVTIEDAAELHFSEHPHVVRLEARPRSAEGTGEVTIRDLVINALRMRPDRIIVGECRGAEALDMLQAMNTGHEGSLTTLHANSPHEVIERLVMMARYAMDVPVTLIEKQITTAFDLIVQLDRQKDGSRRITSMCTCGNDRSSANGVELQELVSWDVTARRYLWHDMPHWLKEQHTLQAVDNHMFEQWCQKTGLSLNMCSGVRQAHELH